MPACRKMLDGQRAKGLRQFTIQTPRRFRLWHVNSRHASSSRNSQPCDRNTPSVAIIELDLVSSRGLRLDSHSVASRPPCPCRQVRKAHREIFATRWEIYRQSRHRLEEPHGAARIVSFVSPACSKHNSFPRTPQRELSIYLQYTPPSISSPDSSAGSSRRSVVYGQGKRKCRRYAKQDHI